MENETKKIAPDDEGELSIRCFIEPKHNKLILHFGKSIRWIGFDTPKQAKEFAQGIINQADVLEKKLAENEEFSKLKEHGK